MMGSRFEWVEELHARWLIAAGGEVRRVTEGVRRVRYRDTPHVHAGWWVTFGDFFGTHLRRVTRTDSPDLPD
jgi:hypothetical protein